MDATEYEFLAENEKITILAKFTHPTLTLIQGHVKDLVLLVEFFLYPTSYIVLGTHFSNHRGQHSKDQLSLQQSDKCIIQTPSWMEVERLEECREEEKDSDLFTQLPAKYIFEISNILLDVTPASIIDADQIRSILKEIFDIRQSKLRKSIEIFFKGDYLHAKINNLQEIELANFRPILPQAFDHLQRLDEATGAASRRASLHTTSFSNNTTFS